MGPRGWVLWVGFSGKKKPSNGTYLGGGFKCFFMFARIWGRFPFWLIFFKGVEITNQLLFLRWSRFSGIHGCNWKVTILLETSHFSLNHGMYFCLSPIPVTLAFFWDLLPKSALRRLWPFLGDYVRTQQVIKIKMESFADDNHDEEANNKGNEGLLRNSGKVEGV